MHTRADDAELILRAANFAAAKHRDQRRKNGDIPYINHPLGVAMNLIEVGGVRDAATLAAAILHDTVEDTATTTAELAEIFGEEIAGIVAEVTDDKTKSTVERKRLQIEHAPTLSLKARLVKLADKLHNLRDTLDKPPLSWDLERIRGYACWGWFVIEAAGEVNEGLQSALAEVLAGSVDFTGAAHRLLPETNEERRALLQSYYLSLG